MKQNDFYSKYVSTHYQFVATSKESFRKRYYVWKSYLFPLLPQDKKSSILEIGSGVGHNLYALQELGYVNVIGTDYSKECVALCKKNGFQSLLVSPKTEKKFYSSYRKKFDMVLLYDVLEHCTPDQAVELLVSVRELLRLNGRVLISVPYANHPFSTTLFFADITHKFIYNEISLSQLLRNSKFSNMKFLPMNSFTLYDDDKVKRIVKHVIFVPLAFFGELFWKIIALSQGILLKECKPTLAAVAWR